MGTRHMAVGESVFDVEAVLEGIDGEFGQLSEDADGNRDKEDEIGMNCFHSDRFNDKKYTFSFRV